MTRERLLTSAVIGMGVLILIGLVVLVVGIVNKAADGAQDPSGAAAGRSDAMTADRAMRTDSVSLGLPAGVKVRRMSAVAGGIAILVERQGGALEIYVVPTHRKDPPLRIGVSGPKAK